MRLLEHEAKRLLAACQVPVPAGLLISSEPELTRACGAIRSPRMLKAQIPTGGRGKAGGVVKVGTSDEGLRTGRGLLGRSLLGHPVTALLLEEPAEVEEELYAAVTYDPVARRPVMILSRSGGIDVEVRAARSPGAVQTMPFDPLEGFHPFRAREIVHRLGFSGTELLQLSDLLCRLVDCFRRFEATLVEVNPLAKTPRGAFVALDARIELDEDALCRHPELAARHDIQPRESGVRPVTPFEQQARTIDAMDHRGVAGRVIEFAGDLGLLIGGGGASLTAFDAILRHGGYPANYCEIGGNPSVKKLQALTALILSRPRVKKLAVIMNVVSNTRADLVARGVIKGVLERGMKPHETIVCFRVPGSWEDEALKILRRYGVTPCDRSVSIDEAARLAVRRAHGEAA
ncbi:MAG: ATP-grasp domain-containing protein [Candidatus Methylomirabilales bacterium]